MFKAGLQRVLNQLGFQVVRSRTGFSPEELEIIRKVRAHTSSSAERITGLVNAVKYLQANRLDYTGRLLIKPPSRSLSSKHGRPLDCISI